MADPYFATESVVGVAGVITQSSLEQLSCLAELDGECQRLEYELGSTAALLELNSRVIEATSLSEGTKLLVNGLKQQLGCSQVALGIVRNRHCQIVAISGVADVDVRAPQTNQIQMALAEALLAGKSIASAASQSSCLSPRAHQQLLQSAGFATVLSVPLRTSDGTIVGVLAFFADDGWVAEDRRRQFIEAAAYPLAATIDTLRRNDQWLGKLGRTVTNKLRVNGRKVAISVGLLAAVLCAPLHHPVGCDCELQPVTRRFVASPHAGIFERSLVKPGDLVTRDQLLARMDGRELRWELAGLEADHSRAGKSRDVNLATSKVAAAQIDRLEMERFSQKHQLLSNRLSNLDIKSPIDGIVLSGDLQRSEGISLTIGQQLFEVAPLNQMVVEVAIADDQITHVQPGMPVDVHLAAFPAKTWEGKLERVHPRSEIRDEQNVFIGEVTLDNPDLALRPGMKGQATVIANRRMLGWILFHKPIEYIARWLTW